MKTGPSEDAVKPKKSPGDFESALFVLIICIIFVSAVSLAWAIGQDSRNYIMFWTGEKVVTVTAALVLVTVCLMSLWRYMSLLRFNRKLKDNIAEREQAEMALRKAHDELAKANMELEGEVAHRRKAESDLITYQERLRNLYAMQQSVREEERANIACEIHDELGQIMMAIKMDLAWMKGKYADQRGLYDKVASLLNLIDISIKSVRRICMELRPDILDHLGLGAAIQWQAEEFRKRTGILCEVGLEEGVELDNDRSTALFRIFQEALTNILRHAYATKVIVRLKRDDDGVMLEIIDNGHGITREELSKPDTYGLLGMRERLYPWRGRVSISGTPDTGTRIEVLIPY